MYHIVSTVPGAAAYLLSGEKPPALPPTATPQQDVIKEDEVRSDKSFQNLIFRRYFVLNIFPRTFRSFQCPATQELESATAVSSSVKVDEKGETSLIMKGECSYFRTCYFLIDWEQ